jgi:ABC transporter substrate binding protein
MEAIESKLRSGQLPIRFFAAEGGLISYGTDIAQSFAQAASYIDRILKGETPADLPLQPPSRCDMVLNLKTAKAMGLRRTGQRARACRRGDRVGLRRSKSYGFR